MAADSEYHRKYYRRNRERIIARRKRRYRDQKRNSAAMGGTGGGEPADSGSTDSGKRVFADGPSGWDTITITLNCTRDQSCGGSTAGFRLTGLKSTDIEQILQNLLKGTRP